MFPPTVLFSSHFKDEIKRQNLHHRTLRVHHEITTFYSFFLLCTYFTFTTNEKQNIEGKMIEDDLGMDGIRFIDQFI